MDFFARLALSVLALAPQIIQTVWLDKSDLPHESKVQAATTATMQASEVAQEIDPADTGKIDAATTITKSIITALQTAPPAQSSQAAPAAQ
jgi:hypothetical protein